ncbi:jg24178, partial [Pararge aegeria aegeria]
IEIRDFGISGTAHLTYDLSGNTHIKSINPDLKVGRIEADMKIVGSNKDYSETINHFLNVRVEELGKKYKHEINTLVGEAIKLAYARVKDWY